MTIVEKDKTSLVYNEKKLLDSDVNQIRDALMLATKGINILSLQIATGAVTVTSILDEDAMGSDSNTALATQQSIKAYVDSSISPTLQSVFDNGQTITIADTDNQTLAITNNDTTNNQDTLTLTNTTTGRSLFIDYNAISGYPMVIDTEQLSNTAFKIIMLDASTANGLQITNTTASCFSNIMRGQAGSTGSNWFFRNEASGVTNAPVVYIEQDNSSDDQDALKIQNDGTGNYLRAANFVIDGDGNVGIGTTSPTSLLHVIQTSTTGKTLEVTRALSSASTADTICTISNTASGDDQETLFLYGAQGAAILKIQSVTTAGKTLHLDQDTEEQALYIDSEATDYATISIQSQVDGTAASIFNQSAIVLNLQSNGGGMYIYSNTGAGANNPLMFLEADDANFDQNLLTMQQDGIGLGIFLDMNNTTTSCNAAIEIDTEHPGGGSSPFGIKIRTAAQGVLTFDSRNDAGTVRISMGDGGTANGLLYLNRNLASASTAGPILKLNNANASDDQACIEFIQAADIKVMDFDACTDGGTSHTTVAGSIKIEMPNGSTGYINFTT